VTERYGPPLLRPRPATDLEQQFWDHCAEQRLCFQRCRECERWRHPPRHACGNCGSLVWDWVESTGRGRVFTWSLTHRAPHPKLVPHVPYATVIVELEEGVRLVSVVRDVAPHALQLGLPVTLAFEVDADLSLPTFLSDPSRSLVDRSALG
jgi:uncharacterized OB-fold protein